ncbi:MAG: MFS transporter [Alphaproteobacteria bacterium]|jgi:MFS family permease|nr:MFS transporter [Alphaproteobacteria bacterium]
MPKNSNSHVTLLASLGSTLEYYDFVVYGMMATYLSVVFFPPHNQAAAVLQSFLVFAVGYFARPLGGTVIGVIGDRWGRKPAFLLSTSLMAASTLFISCLPSYETSGHIAVFLLILFRIIQGLSFGGELPGAMTIVAEFSTEHRRGRKTSLVVASTSLGALLASGVLYLLAATLSREEIIAWGWRLPFMGGGILGLLLLIARNTIQETPAFQALKSNLNTREPLIALFQEHKLSLLRGAALTACMAALIITNLYFPYFIPKFYGYESKDVYFATTVSLVFVILMLPIAGIVADLFRQKETLLRLTCSLYIALSLPIFSLLSLKSVPLLIAFLIIQQLFIALCAPSLFPIILRLFPTEVRYTGIAVCYNLTWALMATLPMAYTALLDNYAAPWVVPGMLSVIAGLSALATWGLKGGIMETIPNRIGNHAVNESGKNRPALTGTDPTSY